MTRGTPTCDDCGRQTWGGPCIHNELWATIVRPRAVPIACPPGEPFLFPLFRYVFDLFLCTRCIERRLGRQLKQEDLSICAWNAPWIENEVHRRHATAQQEENEHDSTRSGASILLGSQHRN